MKKVLVVGLLFVALGGAARAQSSDRKAIQEVVERFLLHLGDKDYDKAAADLAPKALVIITRQRDGQWANSFQTGDEWVAALRNNPNPSTFREPLSNVAVTVDSDRLAYLRADFQILRDGSAQSHGVDQFTLVREGGGWKVAVLAFTSMPIR
jgi:ketosteroid isomerase-like protein